MVICYSTLYVHSCFETTQGVGTDIQNDNIDNSNYSFKLYMNIYTVE